MTANKTNDTIAADAPDLIQEPRLWRSNGWTARVVKNEDVEGLAVEMIMDGESEPALVGPWTMGRDKKNSKPLDASAFNTLVKTASEFRQRQVQQLHATLHQNITINAASGRISVTLDIVPDDDEAMLQPADHSMKLEAQGVTAPERERQRRLLADTLLNGSPRKLWQ